jgi:hypothetical protein
MTHPRILSYPHKVVFAGWVTTTTALQQAGWSLSAEQSIRERRINLAMEFEPARLQMMAEAQDFDFMRHQQDSAERPLVFRVDMCVGSQINIHTSSQMIGWGAIDAQPQFTTATVRSLDDYGIFAKPMSRTEEIIVEPATVLALMEQIKSLQAPELADIAAKNRRARDRHEPIRRQNFHAQIVSLAA